MSVGLYSERSRPVTRKVDGLVIATAPTVEPIARADAKLFARVESSVTADDELFDSLIIAARKQIEQHTGRALMTQTWDWIIDGAPERILEVPLPPLQSVSGIYFTDEDDTEGAAISSSLYVVDVARNRIWLKDGEQWGYGSLRSFRSTRVRFVAGYGATAADASTTDVVGSCPGDIVLAARRMVVEIYEGRGPEIPADVLALLRPYVAVRS